MHRSPTRATTSRYASASTTNADRNTVQLIDIGANLTHDSFDHDRDAVLQRARDASVVQMVVTGASREHSPQALELARAHPGELFATAGVHPHHASEYTAECDAELRELHAHPELVAVRSEEHTSELQSLRRSSYSVFCLTK